MIEQHTGLMEQTLLCLPLLDAHSDAGGEHWSWVNLGYVMAIDPLHGEAADPEVPEVRQEHPARHGFGCPVDLSRDGLLWYINKHLFHPKGYALAFNRNISAQEATPEAPQFTLLYPGHDGEEVRFADDLDREGRDLGEVSEAAFKRASESLYEMSRGWPFRDEPDETLRTRVPSVKGSTLTMRDGSKRHTRMKPDEIVTMIHEAIRGPSTTQEQA